MLMRCRCLFLTRAIRTLAMIVACVWTASPAFADTVPDGARVRVGRVFNLPDFEQRVARHYNVKFRKVVAADIDRDGDVDVVAVTDHGLVVWVNDGQGHLTSQTPSRMPGIAGGPAATTWSRDSDQGGDSIQNDLPSLRLPGTSAHAPPALAASLASASVASARLDNTFGCSVPRAPPL